jgi:hypothetical protein
VEEDLSIELPPDFSEKKMFTVPDNWDPPTYFFSSKTTYRSKDSSDLCAKDSFNPCAETCIIEEEPWMDTGAAKDAGQLGQDDKQSRPPSPPLLLPK